MKKTILFILLITFAHGMAQNHMVADLKIQGNNKLKTSFIKRLASIKGGSALDSTIIEQDIKRLKRLPSVAHAYYQVFLAEDGNYNVFYGIEENFTLIPSLNIYTTNNDEFAYRLGLAEFNAFGRNIAIGGFYQKDVFKSYALNFRAPYLFSKRLGLAFNLQSLTTLEPVFFNNTSANYSYNNKSVEVSGLYEFNFSNKLEIGFNRFEEDYQYQNGETSENVPLELNIPKWLIKGIYDYNTLDYYYQYISGFRSQFNFQFVTSNQNGVEDFYIGWNDFFVFKRVGQKGNWANRIRLGLASNNDTPFAPFSVDNNVNIRGVGNTIDRGTGVIVVNTEYRHTLFEKKWFVLQGNAFIDAGSWRNPGGELSDFSKSKNMKLYPGIGLRFFHKKIYNAVFRIDYGYGVSKDATQGLVFGIGQYF
ncbi:POTRA domain-containing protein [Algibacter sp. Ld11]|uniref:POTRA domain-containing protein n=1 Tax=Algibacter sp. Ld11 TaxID=649150 RepID=UPI00386D513A